MRYLLFWFLLLGITTEAGAQEMMLNGGFEDCDGSAPSGTPNLYNIEYASNWHNIQGTCDLINPCVPKEVSGDPCFGNGCGRFGISPNLGVPEYMYGTTLQLTAGQTYIISFWVMKEYMTNDNKSIGVVMSETVPTASILTATPTISFTPENTFCTKVDGCFTAANSVPHYVVFGPFGGAVGEGLYIIDSVSITAISPTTPLPEANLSIAQPVFCLGDNIVLDGTASANETSHEWKIFSTSFGVQQVYGSGVVSGPAGTLNASSLLSFLTPGSCYRAELTVYGICKDVTTVDFCFANPNIDFIFDGNPVCENTPVDLQVTGDNGWTYTWSDANGQLASGTGSAYQALTVLPTVGNGVYTVTVTTQEGCTHTESIHLNVNTHDNVAPWMDGINGTGEYTYYVSQGDAVFFNSVLSNDHLNEEIQYSVVSNTVPSGYLVVLPGTTGGVFSFSLATSLNTPTGIYHYILKVDDQNSCVKGIDTFDFKIVVICDQCKVCVGFEDRTPSGVPLPPETKAGRCIQAGFSQTVSTGTANVLFQAGLEILEGPYFDAGPGYEAVIDPATCVTDCEDCCTDWDGFHIDNTAYYFYMNHSNDDPTDDYFEITDVTHPFCAYGARWFELYFMDSDTQETYHSILGGSTTQCCALQSTAPENPIDHSSIFWNGMVQTPYGGWIDAPNQVYTVQLILHGCNGATETHYFQLHKTFYVNTPQSNPDSPSPINNQTLLTGSQETTNSADREMEKLEVYPNPATNMLYISSTGTEKTIQIYDEKGRVLTKREKVAAGQGYNLEPFSSGKYYCRIYGENGTYVLKEFIKL